MSIVWVYIKASAHLNELEWSIKLAKLHVEENDLHICGDGGSIHSPQRKGVRYSKWFDSSYKLQAIIDCPDVADDFLWMYDDTFILEPTTLAELSIPYHQGILDRGGMTHSDWYVVKLKTIRMLQEKNLPLLDYSTHFPMMFNKHLLQKTIDEFSTHTRPALIETLYPNHHSLPSEPLPDWFTFSRESSPLPENRVVNVKHFTKSMQQQLIARFGVL